VCGIRAFCLYLRTAQRMSGCRYSRTASFNRSSPAAVYAPESSGVGHVLAGRIVSQPTYLSFGRLAVLRIDAVFSSLVSYAWHILIIRRTPNQVSALTIQSFSRIDELSTILQQRHHVVNN
jgi:hypothetical protein